MRKRLLIIFGSVIGVLLVGLIIAGNYFYSQGVKRGTDIELHSEDEAVNTDASERDQQLFAEAEAWFSEQEPEIFELESYDDLVLKAQYIKHEDDTNKTAVLAHGFRNSGDNMGKYAKIYYDLGFNILLPDARGHGESEGDYIGYGWHDRLDYLDWLTWLIEDKGADEIVVHGNSMGAALVLMLSGEDLPDEVKAIVADSGYSTVKAELAHQLKHIYNLPSFPLLEVTSIITKIRAGYTFEEASAVKQVANNTLPLLIIHGDADDLVPTAMAYEIYEAAGGDKELWIVPDVGHTKAFEIVTEEYQHRVSEFIERVLE